MPFEKYAFKVRTLIEISEPLCECVLTIFSHIFIIYGCSYGPFSELLDSFEDSHQNNATRKNSQNMQMLK